MGKAIAYLLNHWDGLTLFLDDGCVEMDTNPVENRRDQQINYFYASESAA